MKLLSIDWDFFFPERSLDPELWGLYDWSHGESNFLLDYAWYNRASNFLKCGVDLPGVSGDLEGFWARFTFSPRAQLYIADSHMHIYTRRVYGNVSQVASYDAHHDAGYGGTYEEWIKKGRVSCEDWALALREFADVKVIYPRWKTWAMTMEPPPLASVERQYDDGAGGKFDRVFLCRSGGWTPPWLDSDFSAFVDACPIPKSRRTNIDGVKDRDWDLNYLVADLQAFIQMCEMSSSANAKRQFAPMVEHSRRAVESILNQLATMS